MQGKQFSDEEIKLWMHENCMFGEVFHSMKPAAQAAIIAAMERDKAKAVADPFGDSEVLTEEDKPKPGAWFNQDHPIGEEEEQGALAHNEECETRRKYMSYAAQEDRFFNTLNA